MKDFKSAIGSNIEETKAIRIKNASQIIKDKSTIKIQTLKMEYRNLQNIIEDTLDLGAESTTDVATNLKNINSEEFIEKIYNTADKMSILARRIKIRVKIHNTLFPEDRIGGLTQEELDFLADIV